MLFYMYKFRSTFFPPAFNFLLKLHHVPNNQIFIHYDQLGGINVLIEAQYYPLSVHWNLHHI